MSIEQQLKTLCDSIDELTKALEENTAALLEIDEPDRFEEKQEEPPEEPEEEEEEEEPPPPKKTRTRAAKEEPPKKATTSKKTKKSGPRVEEVRDAIRRVGDEVGLEEARAILQDFEVKRTTQLPEDKWQEFIDACNEALEEADDD